MGARISALELLEESGESDLSMRAVARRVGVSPSAVYRHYADREALVSAVAGTGYQELAQWLGAAHLSPKTPDELTDVAVAYVQFALDRPSLFRIVFGDACDRENDQRVNAVAAVERYLRAIVERVFPASSLDTLAAAVRALVHGLAFLHLDGKPGHESPSAVEARVRTTVHAVLEATAN